MKKMLYATNLTFKLPDNFNGGIGEAYELLAKSYKENEKSDSIKHSIDDEIEDSRQILGGEDQFQGTHGIYEYDVVDEEIKIGNRIAPIVEGEENETL